MALVQETEKLAALGDEVAVDAAILTASYQIRQALLIWYQVPADDALPAELAAIVQTHGEALAVASLLKDAMRSSEKISLREAKEWLTSVKKGDEKLPLERLPISGDGPRTYPASFSGSQIERIRRARSGTPSGGDWGNPWGS